MVAASVGEVDLIGRAAGVLRWDVEVSIISFIRQGLDGE